MLRSSKFGLPVKITLLFKGIASYSALVCMDKALLFFLPIGVLFLTSDTYLYSRVEAVLALSVFFIPLLDAGMRTYLSFSYRQSGVDGIKNLEFALVMLAVFFTLAAMTLTVVEGISSVVALVIFRSIFVNVGQFFQQKGRLCDNLLFPLVINIFVSVASFAFFAFFYWLSVPNDVTLAIYFFIPAFSVLIIFSCCCQSVASTRSILEVPSTLVKSLKFSCPAIMSSLMVVGFSNLTKVYVLSEFGEEDMVHYSLAFRAAMLVQLSHLVFTGYTQRYFLISNHFDRLKQLSAVYFCCMATISTLFFVAIVVLDGAIGDYSVPRKLLGWIFVYTIFWCFSSLLESFFIRIGKTYFLLLGSSIFFISFVLYFFNFGVESALDASRGLALSSFIMFLSCVFFIFLSRSELFNSR